MLHVSGQHTPATGSVFSQLELQTGVVLLKRHSFSSRRWQEFFQFEYNTRMAPWASRHGGHQDCRLPSFSRRPWKNRSSVPDTIVSSPTTVLSPRLSTETSSVTSCEEPQPAHLNHIVGHLVFDTVRKSREFEVEAACFEPINSRTWTFTTDKPSDLLVEVNDISFHLHKLPILSRSALLLRLAAKFPTSETACINLDSVPGGADSFALAAKFCYGIDVELTPCNVAGLRCVSEYLEMTESLEEGNVSSKAEAYLNSVVLNSWHESMVVLISCESLLPWAEDLQIIQRTSQSIARKACVPKMGTRNEWWYDEVSSLTLHCFENVMNAMARNLMDSNLMGGALELYAQKWLPGVFVENSPKTSSPSTPPSRLNSPTGVASPEHDFFPDSTLPKLHDVIVEQKKNRFVIETIVTLVPQQRDAVGCQFLLRALRAASMFNCSVDCRVELEKKAGQQLDQASLSDLLIPSFSHTSEYLYDVDLVSRLLDHFLSQEQGVGMGMKHNKFFNKKIIGALLAGGAAATKQSQVQQPSVRCKLVAKLLDSYLAEVARDSKLPLSKFQSLAEAVPVASRVSDDGLYRAIDTYLKTHSGLTELEKKKLCRALDSQRFSLTACMHAAQNERLPLRIVVQVLFGEQLKVRDAITGIRQSIDEDRAVACGLGFHPQPHLMPDDAPDSQAMLHTTNQMEIRALQTELTTMRLNYTELERNLAAMMDTMEQLQRSRRSSGTSWATPWRKANKGETSSKQQKQQESSSSPSRSRPTSTQRWRNSIS